jgi:hypothetical protein
MHELRETLNRSLKDFKPWDGHTARWFLRSREAAGKALDDVWERLYRLGERTGWQWQEAVWYAFVADKETESDGRPVGYDFQLPGWAEEFWNEKDQRDRAEREHYRADLQTSAASVDGESP